MQTMQVQSTKDHSLFKPLNGNRQVNQLHASRIKKSMENQALVSPIIVNENYEIIDGQHRFHALKELDMPIYYIVNEGYGLRETQILNVNHKNWNTKVFMDSYCDLGYPDYLRFREFYESYDFGIKSSMLIAVGHENGELFKIFNNGDFEFDDLFGANERADKISMLKSYFENYTGPTFVGAMLSLFKNENFEFSQFLSKLKLQPNALQPMRSRQQYLLLIEDIYNYKSRNKVSLRY